MEATLSTLLSRKRARQARQVLLAESEILLMGNAHWAIPILLVLSAQFNALAQIDFVSDTPNYLKAWAPGNQEKG
ncbi:MAG TPA: hypothetical protein VN939_03900 [Chthoniobacterales bacterium]|nr:hypothetical protein [Chthoniobacterales bacterium]